MTSQVTHFTIGGFDEELELEEHVAVPHKKSSKHNGKEIPRAVTASVIAGAHDDSLQNECTNGVNAKTAKNRKIFGKVVPRTKSMPVLSKAIDHVSNAKLNETKNKHSNQKSKLNQDRKLHELVKWLHTPVVGYKQNLDQTDIDLVNSLDHYVDLDKYMVTDEEPKDIWKARIKNITHRKFSHIYRSRSNSRSSQKKADEISANGYRLVRRFGYGVSDGCGFPLSLRKDSLITGKDWKNIIDQADQTLKQFESFGGSAQKRRGSLFQPRILLISPDTEFGFEKVWQTGHCLPLRKWTSELFIASKEASKLLDGELKRHLKWNASVEDFRHLLSSDLKYFSANIDSVLVEAKNKQDLTRKLNQQNEDSGITFRRQSFNESVWNTQQLISRKKVDYEKRLKIYRDDKTDGNLNSNQSGKLSSKKIKLSSVFVNSKENSNSPIAALHSKDIATELTSIVCKLILSLTPTEISRILLQPHFVNQENCPDITALLNFQKRIIHLFVSTILDAKNIDDRAKVIAHVIEVAQELKHLRNFHSLKSIIASLQSPPIARLTETWTILYSDYSDHYFEFVFMSDSLKKLDIGLLDLSQSNILFFDDWLRNLKLHCNSKVNQLTMKTKGHWTHPDNLIPWLCGELDSLEQLAMKTPMNEKKVKTKKPSLITRIKRNFSHKSLVESEKAANSQQLQLMRTQLPQPQKNVKETSEKSQEKSLDTSDTLNVDILKLNEYDEREILREISKGLREYQDGVRKYVFGEQISPARNFLLLNTYASMDASMANSFRLEPPSSKKRNNYI